MTRASDPAVRRNWPRSAASSTISRQRWARPSRKSASSPSSAVSLQDAERKEIARELHDEVGPYLFALRAHASSLMRTAERNRAGHRGVAQARQRHPGAGQCLAAIQPAGAGKTAAGRPCRTRPARGDRRAAAAVARCPSRRGDRDGDFAVARRDRRDRGTDHLPHHPGSADQRVPACPRHTRSRSPSSRRPAPDRKPGPTGPRRPR